MPFNFYTLAGAGLAAILLAVSGYQFGRQVAAGEQAARDLAAANEYAAAVSKARDDARAAERKGAELLSQADQAYQQKLRETKNALDLALARGRAGGLYVTADCAKIGTGGLPETGPAAGLDHGPARVRLSAADGDFFIRFASECDATADQLRAAQEVITADRGGR